MSQTESATELVRRFAETFTGVLAGVEGARDELEAMLHPDFESRFHDPGIAPPGAGAGALDRAASLRLLDEFAEAWEEAEAELGNFLEVGESVVYDVRFRARARGSGVPYEGRGSTELVTVRDGLVLRRDFFGPDRGRAVTAARGGSSG